MLSSLTAVLLLVLHSWRRRGGAATAAFFIPGILFGIVRGNVVHAIMKFISGGASAGRPYVPQSPLLPDVGYASMQVVIGWIFAGYLAWTVSEYVLRRLKLENRLFPTVALAGLFLGAISYCMETTAPRVGWWYWEISTVNAFFGRVPIAGIVAWFSIATDLLFPVLFIACSEYRGRWWRWLTLLVFPLHMGAHALYNTVPYIDNVHVVMILAVAALALFNRTRIETGQVGRRVEGKGGVAAVLVDLIPAAAVGTFLAVILRADLLVLGDFRPALTAIPLVILLVLAVRGIPVVVVLILSAAGLLAWRWVGVRALYALVPLGVAAVFYSVEQARRRRAAACVWMAVVVILAGGFVTSQEIRRRKMIDFIRLLKHAGRAEAQGYKELARELTAEALRMEFTDAQALHDSMEFLSIVGGSNVESVRAEVRKRLQKVMQMDPEWTVPRVNWIANLLLDGRLDDAIEEARALVKVQPTVASHRAMLGYLLVRRGKLDEGEKELNAARDLRAGDETRINLAVVAAVRGDRQKAADFLNEVLAKDPGHPVARFDLEHLTSDPETVKADIKHLVPPKTFAPIGRRLDRSGLARAEAGDLTSAVKLLERAVHYAPRAAVIRSNYAAMLVRSGRPIEEAIAQFETALRLDKGLLPARRNLVRLYVRLARRQIGENQTEAARKTLRRALPYAAGRALAEIRQMLQELGDAAE